MCINYVPNTNTHCVNRYYHNNDKGKYNDGKGKQKIHNNNTYKNTIRHK